ncbi:MAG: glycosyltransferase [Selenomonadaceae bacterium]|nr:glycosyltransferase [Selenomonadaceae bacterium]
MARGREVGREGMQENGIAISVIIPMYNTSAYVRECVDSVLAQTFRDFEIIIVDDCSTDGSLALCRELYGNLPQVTILHHERNRTVGAARNTGMGAARGKYIAFLDSDDLYMPEALERLYRAAEEHRADVVHSPGCYLPNGSVEHIGTGDEFRTLIYDRLPMPKGAERLPDSLEERIWLWAERRLCTAVWDKLFRREFLFSHHIRFEEDIVPGQDGIFLFRCVLEAENFIRIPDIFYIYRRPPTSVTHSRREAPFLARVVESMLRKLRSLDSYMDGRSCFLEHPEWREKVRNFVILDTDPFFAQECYLGDGSVAGDLSLVHQVFRDWFGRDAWFVEYFFHAYHRANGKNAPERGVQMNYVFPWQLIPEGSRLVIYGAGEVGKCFYEQAARFGYLDLVGIVDRNAGGIHTLGIPVRPVSDLLGMEYDYVLISVINGEAAGEIRRDLVAMGIPDERILWDGRNYSIDDYYRNVHFPILRSGQRILYGAGLNAREYGRYLGRTGRGHEIACFAVTQREAHHPDMLCGKPLLSLGEAIRRFPQAKIVVVLQEKYHEEVRATLRDMGRSAEKFIGLRSMTSLLGEEGIRELSEKLPDISVAWKPGDYSMLYLCPKKAPRQVYEFYPMTQVPLSGEDLRNLRNAMEHGHDAMFGRYPEREVSSERGTGHPNVFLAMASSRKDAPVSRKGAAPPYLHKVLAGAASFQGTRERDGFYDDTGENISDRNPFYSELTVTYWLWKHAPKEEYLGICHYRRHFILTEEILGELREGTVDLLLSRPRLTFPDVKGFLTFSSSSMDMEDYRRMLAALRERAPEEEALARRVADGQLHFPNNMLIARREIFEEYCRWMFGILEEIWEGYRKDKAEPSLRCMGYIGELLTTVFVAKSHGKYRMGYADYELLE